MKRVFLLLTGGAFLALILLIAALAANGIYQLERVQKQMDLVVELHNRKIETVTNIQIQSRTRADRLLRMVIESDPFSRDQLYLEFIRAGFLVGSGRQELRQLGLTPEEQALFDEQSELVRVVEPLQEKVVDDLATEQVEQAWNLVVTDILPRQKRFNELLAGMREKFQQANNLALWEARQEYRRNLFFTLLFGISATVLGIGLAWFTLKRLVHNSREINWQMTALEASRAAFEIEATHDAMTGLANRKLFYDRLKQALLHARRHNGKVGVLFVDLDNFKAVNDLYGHHVGDALLSETARRLLASVRESDTVARAGGDEFMVILEDLGGREDCQAAVEKIEASLASKASLHGVELTISASIGHALYPDDSASESELMRAADISMYRIKARRTRAR